jgi:hypothetical protein
MAAFLAWMASIGNAVVTTATDTTAGRIPVVGWMGLGAATTPTLSDFTLEQRGGFYRCSMGTAIGGPDSQSYSCAVLVIRTASSGAPFNHGHAFVVWRTAAAANHEVWVGPRATLTGAVGWSKLWGEQNTTVDVNGFVKEASPIVRLSNEGHSEPAKPLGATWQRLGTGHYVLTGVPPLSAAGWQVEVPHDMNGNRLLFIQPTWEAGVLIVRTYEPAFASGLWVAGAAKDIPSGRWVDLRFEEAA